MVLNVASSAVGHDPGQVVGVRAVPQRRLMVRLKPPGFTARSAAVAVAVEGGATGRRPAARVEVGVIPAQVSICLPNKYRLLLAPQGTASPASKVIFICYFLGTVRRSLNMKISIHSKLESVLVADQVLTGNAELKRKFWRIV